jgi:hypothetical protein
MDTILTPVLVLIAWSLVMLAWLYALRIPALQKSGLDPQSAAINRKLDLPAPVMWPADNYNHLMEQPTIFYAAAFYVHLSGHADALRIGLAWAYVGLRIVHSLVQATANIIMARFAIFTLSSFVLTALVVRELLALLR